jgi:epoxyqueuosine reductase
VNSSQFKRFARQCGADIVGIADLGLLKGLETEPADLLEGFSRAVSIGVRLSDPILDAITDAPTPLYQQHYAKVNALLDLIALRASQYLQGLGFKALPIPASQALNTTEWYSYISHKAVAIAAGVGWQGKSLLVVNPQHGPRIRLVTVLTDADLDPDEPVRNRCGRCTECTEACPVGAIKNVNTKTHYSSRNEAIDFKKCVEQVWQKNTKLPYIENPICGVCIRACPWGKRSRRSRVKAAP